MLRAFGRSDLIRPPSGEADVNARRRGRTRIVPRGKDFQALAIGYTAIWYYGNIFPLTDEIDPWLAVWPRKWFLGRYLPGARVVTLRQEILDPRDGATPVYGGGRRGDMDQYGMYGRSGLCVFRAERVDILSVSPDEEFDGRDT